MAVEDGVVEIAPPGTAPRRQVHSWFVRVPAERWVFDAETLHGIDQAFLETAFGTYGLSRSDFRGLRTVLPSRDEVRMQMAVMSHELRLVRTNASTYHLTTKELNERWASSDSKYDPVRRCHWKR